MTWYNFLLWMFVITYALSEPVVKEEQVEYVIWFEDGIWQTNILGVFE